MKNRKIKEILYKGVALMGAVVMFITTPAFAAESHHGKGNGKGKNPVMNQETVSDTDREYWENLEYEVFDIEAYEDYIDELEANGALEGGVSLLATEIPGAWIQASDGRWWYRHTDGGYTTNGWEYIGGKWYYFDSLGWMATGWIKDNGEWYYCDSTSGAMQTGWVLVNGKWYYLTYSSGAMATGWVYTNSTWYYCNETNGDWIDNLGTKLIQSARKHEGNPYVWGGDSLTNGVDCSGFVVQIHKLHGVTVPKRQSTAQYYASKSVDYPNLQPGDLVFSASSGSTTVSHVSFYMGRVYGVGDDMVISALNPKKGICVGNMPSNVIGYGTFWR